MTEKVSLKNCRFGYRCTNLWELMDSTLLDNVRFCQQCEREVHFCSTDAELADAIRHNFCVAIETNDADEEATGPMLIGLPESLGPLRK